MYVCLCKGITDHQIRRAVAEGADSMRDLRRELGVCTDCGKCGVCANRLLRDTLNTAPAVNVSMADAPQWAVG
ncbi:BFD domain-containing protein (2Fe-2S)-binding domain-containing protein [Ectothiorhodospira sp. PHS-1]|uniref:bacterioferritin-associated ferredoxin n=1 Tax=Ectothiorhodospira sp. PHS-1 TaxID=519989 RepID=UPI00024A81DD|nr:bacterioferritin-associated ferredoxin [Ectothiorhodospira sp. PHS-1]EHQ52075.1 BFD domain-containing protein (2Fe-2S)-binding domain-containing protein [Ectothiorhodospira sp. PHS-1]